MTSHPDSDSDNQSDDDLREASPLDHNNGNHSVIKKKKKPSRACDVCRRRKQKCDANEMPNNTCSGCIASDLPCTFLESSKKRAPAHGYVDSLEVRLAKAEELLAQLRPDQPNFVVSHLGDPIDKKAYAIRRKKKKPEDEQQPSAATAAQPPTAAGPNGSAAVGVASGSTSRMHSLHSSPIVPQGDQLAPFQYPREDGSYPLDHRRTSTLGSSTSSGQFPSHHDDESDLKSFVQLNHRDEQLFKRYMGKSSGIPILFSAIGFKYGAQPNLYAQEIKLHRATSRSRFWRIPPWEATPSIVDPSEHGASQNPQLTNLLSPNPFASWPEPSLAATLIENYFDRHNILLPLLHKPTFYAQYNAQLWSSDPGFARTCLLIFAVGSHYVDDPRVLFPKEDGGTYGPDSAGWIFYHAFGRMVRHRLAPTELWDLQVSVLLVTFLQHSSQPGACWVFVGEGLRWAQDVGIHRSGVQRSADPVVNEGYRRALWCLYILDVQLSGFLGRQVALQDDTFDVGLPWDCDDAFWQDATPFQQPAGVPSTTSAFIWQIKLLRILSTALTSLYAIKPQVSTLSPAEMVSILDARLDEWISSLPEFLRWDPDRREADVWYRQSADLILKFNMVKTYIHRPFLPSPRNPIPISTNSFVVCVDAASQCADVIDCYSRKTREAIPHLFESAYTCALILLIAVWSEKTSGSDARAAMSSVEKCSRALTQGERRFFGIGRARDAITVLSAVRVDYSAQARKRNSSAQQQRARPPPPVAIPHHPPPQPAVPVYPEHHRSQRHASRSSSNHSPQAYPPPPLSATFPHPSSYYPLQPPVHPSTSSQPKPYHQYPPDPSAYPQQQQQPQYQQQQQQQSSQSPYTPTFGSTSHSSPDYNPDFSQGFGSYPDFLAEGLDPTMTLFGGGGDAYFADLEFLQSLEQAQGAGAAGGGEGGAGGAMQGMPIQGRVAGFVSQTEVGREWGI